MMQGDIEVCDACEAAGDLTSFKGETLCVDCLCDAKDTHCPSCTCNEGGTENVAALLAEATETLRIVRKRLRIIEAKAGSDPVAVAVQAVIATGEIGDAIGS